MSKNNTFEALGESWSKEGGTASGGAADLKSVSDVGARKKSRDTTPPSSSETNCRASSNNPRVH